MDEQATDPGAEKAIKPSYRTRLVWIFIFGFLLGMVIKTEAVKRVTMGFEDYKLSGIEKQYDLVSLEEAVKEKEEAAQDAQLQESAPAAEPTEGAEEGSCEADSGTCQVQ